MKMKMVRFGIYASNRDTIKFGTPVEQIFNLARIAEDSECVESFWVGDNVLATPRLDSITLLASVAASTRRVKLGVACMASFTIRNPILFAYQWASLDVLSKGRTLLIVCAGGEPGQASPQREFLQFGFPPKMRTRVLEECIEIVRLLWSKNGVTYKGRFYELEGTTVLPKPYQKDPMILIAVRPGGTWSTDKVDFLSKTAQSALGRVARLSDGWATSHVSPEDFAKGFEMVQIFARARGRTVEDNALDYAMNVNESRDDALSESKQFLEARYSRTFRSDEVEIWTASGPRQRCIDTIERFVDAGVKRFVIKASSKDPEAQSKIWVKDIFPCFR